MNCTRCGKRAAKIKGVCKSCYVTLWRQNHWDKFWASYKAKAWYRFGGNALKALERDNYTCRQCDSKDKKLDVHHIDGKGSQLPHKEQNNELENLISLCRRCHILTEGRNKLMNKWSKKHDQCIKCATTNSKHASRGLCVRCYEAARHEYKKKWYKQHITYQQESDNLTKKT